MMMLLVLAIALTAFVLRAFHLGRSGPIATVDLSATPAQVAYQEVSIEFGRGYVGKGWQLYFNEPDATIPSSDYENGIDDILAAAIGEATTTLDIAAFELNSDAVYDAIAAAHERGIQVRIVTDDDHGLRDEGNSHLRDLLQAGIPVVDDSRSGLMHNKFVIIDQRTVWTGSLNLTVNGSYRNNNNLLVVHSAQAAAAFQAEFEEMFERKQFGKRSPDDGTVTLDFDGGEVSIIFAAEADEIGALTAEIAQAERSIRFMTFVFSLEELAQAMLLQAENFDFTVEGIFEERNSTANWSQLPALHCAGAKVRQDGNRYILHHKVIIIDEDTVITGSFNFSSSAAERNDENIVIVRNAAIAGLYLDEWQRLWDSAEELASNEVVCN